MKIAQAGKLFRPKARNELVEIEIKLDRLLDLQLDGSLSQTEYATKSTSSFSPKRIWRKKLTFWAKEQ